MIRKDVATAAIGLSLALSACSGSAESQGAPPPPEVTVATPLVSEIVDWDDFVGRFEAIENVDVKPRVTGYLVGIHFRDGQYVRRGQLLFTIDSRPAQAQLDQARAPARSGRGAGASTPAPSWPARAPWRRSARPASRRSSSARRRCGRPTPTFAAARATLRARQLDVGFTRVFAPISGQVSERRVDRGNAVTADQTVLTTIVSTDPMHFAFDGSEALLLRFQRQSGDCGSVRRSASAFRTRPSTFTPGGSTSSTMP